MSNWQQRATSTGFLQYREGTWDRWRFQILYFRGNPGEPGTCTVLAVDGRRECDMDAKNRVKIEGKWFSPLHWNH